MNSPIPYNTIKSIHRMLKDPKMTYHDAAMAYEISVSTARDIALGHRHADITGGAIEGRVQTRAALTAVPRLPKQFGITQEVDSLIDEYSGQLGMCRGEFLESLVLDYHYNQSGAGK